MQPHRLASKPLHSLTASENGRAALPLPRKGEHGRPDFPLQICCLHLYKLTIFADHVKLPVDVSARREQQRRGHVGMHEILKRDLCGAGGGAGLKRVALRQRDARCAGDRVAANPKRVESKTELQDKRKRHRDARRERDRSGGALRALVTFGFAGAALVLPRRV